ncbi:MAG: Dabb family protein [Paludibacteraceae bacterium]
MVRHIVCFKLAESTPETRATARDILLSMRGKVPTAQHIEVFLDELHSARSFDVMLQVDVQSFEVLDQYQNDPYHCNIVKKHMHAVAAQSIALDFEL